VIQGEKELTPTAMLSTNVDQLANNTVKVIYALLDPLLEALATDKFDNEAFLSIDRRQQKFSTTTTTW
jgi:hypothetical protein